MEHKRLGKQIVKTKSAKEIEKLSKRDGFHAVGGCPSLYLNVKGNSVSWVLRVMINGKRREMGLGPYPLFTLEDARHECMRLRKLVYQGIDPLAEKRKAKLARKVDDARAITFDQCAEAYLNAHEQAWKNPKHRLQWRATLTTYASPVFGHLPVSAVDTALVMQCLEKIWHVKTETASRLRGRIEQILDWATVRQYREGENPARWKGHLDKLLPAKNKIAKPEHHPALPYTEVHLFVTDLRNREGIAARALEFLILTAVRSGEVRGATWGEVDLKTRTWTIPADRMKAEREHRVPLSSAAMAILDDMPRIAGNELIFPGAKGRSMSDMTMGAVLKRMGRPDLTVHGFRSTFRDWAADTTLHPNEVAEMALAHAVGSKVEAAYRRSDMFEKRRKIMDDWARYIDTKPDETGKVVPIMKITVA